MLLASPMMVSAVSTGDDMTPANVNVNYVLSLNTGFSVGSPSEMTFRGRATGIAQTVEADGQNASLDKPWGNISNNGEISQTFYLYLNASNAVNVTLKIADNNYSTGEITLNATGQSIGSVAPNAGIKKLFAKAEFSYPIKRETTSRKLQVSTYAPTWSFTLSPTSATMYEGVTKQFTTTSVDQNGNTLDATVVWSKSIDAFGTIDNNGLFTAISAGTTTIYATGTRGTDTISLSATVSVLGIVDEGI
jgi:hypothetical protein